MKKSTLSFRAVRNGTRLFNFLKGNRSRALQKSAVAVAASFCMMSGASAQCNTFQNADEANPLLSVLEPARTVRGFAFADIDGDGDQDVYLNYVKGSYPKELDTLYFFRNTGTAKHPVFKRDANSGFGKQLLGYQNQFKQFADIDGDGDLDYFTSTDANRYTDFADILFFKNEGTSSKPNFVLSSDNPVGFANAHISVPFAFADMDSDGDLDFYTCDVSGEYGFGYYQRVHYNTGSATNPEFDYNVFKSNTIDKNLGRTYYDWNKDGLLDFFGMGIYTAYGIQYIKNTGPKKNPKYIKAPDESPAFKNGAPYRIIDLNNDGAPEVFDYEAHYSILAPVAVIKDSILQNGNTSLYSAYREAAYTYRWELDGKTIAGANKYAIVPKQSGTYTLYIINACGTGVSLEYKFVRNLSAATEDKVAATAGSLAAAVLVKAYPNPFVSSITLQLPGTLCTVKITDMAGRVLLSQTTSATVFHTGEALRPGIYAITVWSSNSKVFSTTVNKQ